MTHQQCLVICAGCSVRQHVWAQQWCSPESDGRAPCQGGILQHSPRVVDAIKAQVRASWAVVVVPAAHMVCQAEGETGCKTMQSWQ